VFQIVPVASDNAIGIFGWPLGTIRSGGGSSAEQEVDAVAVQSGEEPTKIE
jgi:hypothetical protein